MKASSFKSWTSELNLFRSQRILFCRRLPRAMPRSSPSPLLAINSPPPQNKRSVAYRTRDHFRFLSRGRLSPFSFVIAPVTTPQPLAPLLLISLIACSSPNNPHFPHLCPEIPNTSSFVAGRNLSLDTGRVKGAGLYFVRDTGHDRD